MDILNLPKFNILSIAENKFDFQIRVETNSPPSACPHCGCIAILYKHDSREQLCMDLPIHGKRVGLLIKRQRYRCRECYQTFWERLDHTIDEKRNCTKRLLSYVEKQSLKRTFVSIRTLGLTKRRYATSFVTTSITLKKRFGLKLRIGLALMRFTLSMFCENKVLDCMYCIHAVFRYTIRQTPKNKY
uniref:transposase family protein n=1 Tax=Paenibacillus alginolyticus TaxID=59839 RepID=UPI001FE293F7|nr:transposase family protein [Paenibacillus frigoriresistens]